MRERHGDGKASFCPKRAAEAMGGAVASSVLGTNRASGLSEHGARILLFPAAFQLSEFRSCDAHGLTI
jgi:hypothetical protein